ncbi:uncharacterized protein LOC124278930 [Haliotis rubra]|uniref:uncharacterized protein LOC124278930 n=1 Tax=Haliotis rubra TaxID=36100 RepID=UPI001EE5B6B9|nr:uncharacterized protein LOC124278930 [Haliotis rubra]
MPGNCGRQKLNRKRNNKRKKISSSSGSDTNLGDTPATTNMATATGNLVRQSLETIYSANATTQEQPHFGTPQDIEDVLQTYSHIFQEQGGIKGMVGKIYIPPNAKPVFLKARPLPYAMKEKVDKELDRLLAEGIIESVQHSEVGHSDSPCTQLPIDEKSKDYTTINTHRGLFRFNRLPFGISSSPGIFQRCIDNLLQNIPMTGGYQDDIIISGQDDTKHIENLTTVLEKLSTAGTHHSTDWVQSSLTRCLMGPSVPYHLLHEHSTRQKRVEKEGLSVIFGIKRFHQYLYGRHFLMSNDHKPLQFLFGEKKGILDMSSPRIQRWAITLSAYSYSFVYTPGKDLGHADAMSRLPLHNAPSSVPTPPETLNLTEFFDSTPVTATDIAAWTNHNPLLSQVRRFTNSGWLSSVNDDSMRPFFSRRNELSSHGGVIL